MLPSILCKFRFQGNCFTAQLFSYQAVSFIIKERRDQKSLTETSPTSRSSNSRLSAVVCIDIDSLRFPPFVRNRTFLRRIREKY